MISLLTFVVSLHLPAHFHRGRVGFSSKSIMPGFRPLTFTTTWGWMASRMWLVVLTTFLTPLCVLISWKSIHERVKEFFIMLLVLETALIGVFRLAGSVPLLLLLGIHADPDGAADRHVWPWAARSTPQ